MYAIPCGFAASSAVKEGAPSTSACDSTVSRCFGDGRQAFFPKVLKLGMDTWEGSQEPLPMEIDGDVNPFRSQQSTPSTTFNNSFSLSSVLQTSTSVHKGVTPTFTSGPPDSVLHLSSPTDTHPMHARGPAEGHTGIQDNDLFNIYKDDPLLQEGNRRMNIVDSFETGGGSNILDPSSVRLQ